MNAGSLLARASGREHVKFIASWLIALVVAPFTAPFPTCDLMALFGEPAHATPIEASAGATSAPSIAAQPPQVPAGPAKSVSVSNDAAMPVVSVRSTLGRGRLSPLLRSPSAVTMASPFSTASTRTARLLPCWSGPASTSTVLRV